MKGKEKINFFNDGFVQSAFFCLVLIVLDLITGEVFIAKTAGLSFTREDNPLIYWVIVAVYMIFMCVFLMSYSSYKKRAERQAEYKKHYKKKDQKGSHQQ